MLSNLTKILYLKIYQLVPAGEAVLWEDRRNKMANTNITQMLSELDF